MSNELTLTLGTADDLYDDFPELLTDIGDIADSEERGRRGEPIYLVISEVKCGGYNIYLNDQFNVAGGKQLNLNGLCTLKEAREFCENWKFNLAKNRYCYDETFTNEDGKKEKVLYEQMPYGELMAKVDRYQVVEYVSPTVQYPDKVYYPIEKPKRPTPLNAQKYHESKLFLWYLGACKKNLRSHQFMSIVARKLNRKVSRQLAFSLVTALERLSAASKVNPKMQAIIKANFGIVEFPQLCDAIKIPSVGKNYR